MAGNKSVYKLALEVTSKADLSGIDKASKSLKGLGALAGAGVAAGIYATAKAVSFLSDTVIGYAMAGSRMEESQNKFDAVFREQAPETLKTLEAMSTRLQRSKYDMRDWASSFQDLFVPLGFTRDKAAELSTTLTELTVDVASFYDSYEPEAAARFSSALVGNHEAVRGYGIVMTESTIKQELFRMGIEKSYATVTAQEKVQARLNVITNSLKDAQGDAERTADSWANQQRRLSGIMNDFAADIGNKIMPIMGPLLHQYVDLAEVITPQFLELLDKLGPTFERWGEGAAKALEDVPELLDQVGNFLEKREMEVRKLKQIQEAEAELLEAGVIEKTEFQKNIAELEALAKKEWDAFWEANEFDAENITNPVTRAAAEKEIAYQKGLKAIEFTIYAEEELAKIIAARVVPAHKAETEAIKEKQEALLATAIAYGGIYKDTDALFDDLEKEQQKKADAEGEWVEVAINHGKRLGEIDELLGGDLLGDQAKEIGEGYKELAEGSAEWIAAYDLLDADLSDTTRADLIRERAELLTTQGDPTSAYTGDLQAAEEASDRVIEIQQQLDDRLRGIIVDSVLAKGGLTEATIEFFESIGELQEGAGKARLEYIMLEEQVGVLAKSDAYHAASVEVKADAYERLTKGMADTAAEALARAKIEDAITHGDTSVYYDEDLVAEAAGKEIEGTSVLTIAVTADVTDAKDKIEEAEGLANEWEDKKYIAALDAFESPATDKINEIERRMRIYDASVSTAILDVEFTPAAQAVYDAGMLTAAAFGGPNPAVVKSFNVGPSDPGYYHNRAVGGALLPGYRYLVGEQRAEIVEVGTPGAVYPQGLGDGSGGMQVTNHITFAKPSDLRSSRSSLLFEIEDIFTQAYRMVGVTR